MNLATKTVIDFDAFKIILVLIVLIIVVKFQMHWFLMFVRHFVIWRVYNVIM